LIKKPDDLLLKTLLEFVMLKHKAQAVQESNIGCLQKIINGDLSSPKP